MRIISADRILPMDSPPIDEGFIVVDDKGMIAYVGNDSSRFNSSDVERLHGWIIPGFINAHCHLELSHMKGMVPTGLGLIPFITAVVQKRGADPERILDAIQNAEDEMIRNGIVAVGDISNTTDTLSQKKENNIHYTTFVELFDFLQDHDADKVFNTGKEIYDNFDIPLSQSKSLVPHAPYSVSVDLFNLINRSNREYGTRVISIHNQETPPENELFLSGTGAFRKFYEDFGINLKNFQALEASAIQYLIDQSDPNIRTLLVHNSMSTSEDIQKASIWNENIFWVTCPNANLYIENRLPDYSAFVHEGVTMAVGTDSLTSNWQLSILEEIKTIQRYNSYLSTEELLRWSTYNGAEALDIQDRFGCLVEGKSPGINLLEFGISNSTTLDKASVKRLF
jgi:cytosine/adenosine deaminase-related metal-dependent hydrolase